MQYLFNSSTTWTSGRNVLYEEAMKRDTRYLYYIFMDDDIQLAMLESLLPFLTVKVYVYRVRHTLRSYTLTRTMLELAIIIILGWDFPYIIYVYTM